MTMSLSMNVDIIMFQAYYKALCLIGQGTYGNVYKCRVQFRHAPAWRKDDGIVAVKKFKKAGVGSDTFTQRRDNKCKRELQMLTIFSENPHPHIVRLLDYFCTQGGKLCLVFEYIDRTLLDVLEGNPKGMQEDGVKRIIWQLLVGLKELHSRNIMHRDIKPENVLITRRGIVKICDLGFARYDPSGETQCTESHWDGMSEEMTQYISTRWYRSPELLLRQKRYTKAVDIWSIGCIMIELLSGRPAFPGKNDMGVLSMILEVVGNVPTDQGQGLSQSMMLKAAKNMSTTRESLWMRKWQRSVSTEVQSFLSMCLKTDPRERATVEQLLNHEWLSAHTSEWKTGSFEHDIHVSVLQTKSIQSLVMACKRLRIATSVEEPADKHQQKSLRRESTKDFMLSAYNHTPISPILPFESKQDIVHGYYTPQLDGSRGPQDMKYRSNRYWLDTPGGKGMMSPKLNQTTAQTTAQNHCLSQNIPGTKHIHKSDSDQNNPSSHQSPQHGALACSPKHHKKTLAKKVGGMIQKIFQ